VRLGEGERADRAALLREARGRQGDATPHYRFHDLRHTYGTLFRREGKTFSDIAAIMGITEAMAHVYAHEDTEKIQREATKLGTNSAIAGLARLALITADRCYRL
jgi:integrase